MTKPHFSADPETRWLKDGRTVELLQDFSFTDQNGKTWLAKKGRKVNGSSIPRPLWPLIGSPFVGKHRNASIIHDVFCIDKNAPSDEVHQMYYDACICAGVNKTKAQIMLTGIKIGGPTWD
ncbi:DUF1353 domain-containing protein [Thalassotalea euphylliae]|uniref:DUF1353 domain-containing protein n=1 Tax=Thalassotalea euphylliae TaxID=1655234 RepID=A0A3E0U3E0_9GAMM|nr:DUF1353 domain-containing protein [Thalassotalea euphylliae]REL31083.1 DUF1353 domain-containing protein [Thalassotalea euphylliae]